jgi:hypothetical protein
MAEETQETQGMLAGMNGNAVDPVLRKKIDSYGTMLMDMVHNNATKGKVIDMLKAGEPAQSIPATALTINETATQMVQETGETVPPEVLLPCSVDLVGDLIDTGNAAGVFQVTEEQIPAIYQDTVQQYIQSGLKNGTIDPVELQAAIEPLLSEEDAVAGGQIGQSAGLPPAPTNQMVMDSYAKKKNNGGKV